MKQRQPELPDMMEGGPDNPLGPRALYLRREALPDREEDRVSGDLDCPPVDPLVELEVGTAILSGMVVNHLAQVASDLVDLLVGYSLDRKPRGKRFDLGEDNEKMADIGSIQLRHHDAAVGQQVARPGHPCWAGTSTTGRRPRQRRRTSGSFARAGNGGAFVRL